MADMALDDIIKKKKSPRAPVKSNRGVHNGPARGRQRQNIPVSTRPKRPEVVTDARMKIIQKNRAKLTDARDKLAEIAKQSDARLKLEKLRSGFKKPGNSFGTISRKSGRNGKLQLSTNKIPPLLGNLAPYPLPGAGPGPGHGPRHVMPMNHLGGQPMPVGGGRTVNYHPPVDYQEEPVYQDDYSMDLQNNPSYVNNWSNKNSVNTSRLAPSRPVNRSVRKTAELDRPRQLKVVARAPQSLLKLEPAYHDDDWSFESKSRTIIDDEDLDDEDKYYRSSRQPGVKSRLDSMKSRQEMNSRSKSSPTTGYRIVVSNLQANVTQEDIKELFEDVGELLVSRLVRPGTAEVIYKTLKDATKAVETYHNRQLDGHPM
ncbi:Similar to POLDIP3: Polymerase delta-interacting protein 3 (Homo sapiens), partial [Cotesia congregata]